MADIKGFRELSQQLSLMGKAAGGKALRSAVMQASLPAFRAAQAAAPVADPPYKLKDGREVDPYPRRTHKGRLVTPGFTKRNVRRKSRISKDKTKATVSIGVDSEAFYAVQFIELGTSKIQKRPWLEPAFRASQEAMKNRLRDRLKALIDKAAK